MFIIIMSNKLLPQVVQTVYEVCSPHSIRVPHKQLFSALRKAGQAGSYPSCRLGTDRHQMHGRAFEQKVSLIICHVKGARLTQAPFLWDISTPAQCIRQ